MQRKDETHHCQQGNYYNTFPKVTRKFNTFAKYFIPSSWVLLCPRRVPRVPGPWQIATWNIHTGIIITVRYELLGGIITYPLYSWTVTFVPKVLFRRSVHHQPNQRRVQVDSRHSWNMWSQRQPLTVSCQCQRLVCFGVAAEHLNYRPIAGLSERWIKTTICCLKDRKEGRRPKQSTRRKLPITPLPPPSWPNLIKLVRQPNHSTISEIKVTLPSIHPLTHRPTNLLIVPSWLTIL